MSAIAIPEAVRADIYAHARAAFPAECCGYLVGPRGGTTVTRAIRCRNAQRDGGHPTAPERGDDTGFVIDGPELFAFARSLDGDEPARIIYHSHPHGRAYFSDVDRDVAIGPRDAGGRALGTAYPVQHLVIGVTHDRVVEAAQYAWNAGAGGFVELARWAVP